MCEEDRGTRSPMRPEASLKSWEDMVLVQKTIKAGCVTSSEPQPEEMLRPGSSINHHHC